MSRSNRARGDGRITLLVDREARVLCAAPWPQMIGMHPWEFCWKQETQLAWREAFVKACMFRSRVGPMTVSLRIEDQAVEFTSTVEPLRNGIHDAGMAVCYLTPIDQNCMLDLLSRTEYDVWRLVTAGKNNKQVARALGIKPATVRAHLASIRGKLGIKRMEELAG